ncbi:MULTISPECIES: Shedu anti-phage system protein SduA domain-containing protein [Vibrio harveyi group]|uniref:DUF4263 domain-containing protein n=1 Tax=Vibrio alginolyticus TaxID=663 RepID=A0AA36UTR3_VIBAL|nr:MULTISPECIES: Shedu anti-phage system protein SduA domain-containing protein [Vibrio harveyi group]EGQ9137403.1 DUF4263 domain-containing protein [Vibrio alginolyticus]EHA1205794.1 DUF4263 domain-containing protein [Vibrio alginolyticus]KOE02044.1 hypothetical protein ACS83_12955 [Vibrio alginolyticus]MCR9328912.1 DUF4263 domain-containing protein [Vibrio alginolyticus]MCR9334976.1 DUF4263 domain-containing protein [Vibrio alginolyticus]
MMYEKLKQAIDEKGERSAMSGIKSCPSTLFWTTVSSGGHSKFVLYEFPLGSKYRADFVVVWSCSGKWEITFIECENTDDRIVNKNGTPSQRFNQAISQLGDWRDYLSNNKLQVQQDLAKWCAEKDILGFSSGEYISNESGQLLSDMDTIVDFKFKIIMGRRENYSTEARKKVAQLESTSGFSFSTYDRLLSSALEHDKRSEDRNARVNLSAPNCV